LSFKEKLWNFIICFFCFFVFFFGLVRSTYFHLWMFFSMSLLSLISLDELNSFAHWPNHMSKKNSLKS
jgi:ABC-type multidrug transport system permease subunit